MPASLADHGKVDFGERVAGHNLQHLARIHFGQCLCRADGRNRAQCAGDVQVPIRLRRFRFDLWQATTHEKSLMFNLLTRLASIVMLRLGPQDLPAGRAAMLICIALYVMVTAISLGVRETDSSPVLVLLVAVAVPLVAAWLLLRWRRQPQRYEQTTGALFGTSALLSAISMPLSQTAGSEPSVPIALMLLVIFFWSFAVDAHIWRHALEIAFSSALALTVILFAISLLLINTLAGPL